MKIKNNKYDTIINALCLIMLIGSVLYLIISWKTFPNEVPMHHDFTGKVDRWGEKSELLVFPVINWIMYSFLTIVEHFPQIWNTGVKITEENKERVYRTLKNMLTTTKALVVGVFTYMTIQTALSLKLSAWFLPAFMLLLFGNIIFWVWKLMRSRTK